MRNFIHDLFENLITHPMKTTVTLLAMAVGVFSLTLLVAVLGGLQMKVAATVSNIGADVVVVHGDALTTKDARRIRHLLPTASVGLLRLLGEEDVAGVSGVRVLETSVDVASIRRWEVEQGRFLDPVDESSNEPNCVVSHSLSVKLGLVPGTALRLRKGVCRVAGVVEGQAGIPGMGTVSGVDFVCLPISQRGGVRFDMLLVKNPGVDPAFTARKIQGDVQSRDESVRMITPEVLVKETNALIRSVKTTYGTVSALTLLLGGVTLMSFMTLNVRDRYREIGLRRALGASRSDVFQLFLFEGILLTGCAGVMGAVSAFLLLSRIGHQLKLPVHVHPSLIMTGASVALVVGACFAWLPARAAARMNPADAMRD